MKGETRLLTLTGSGGTGKTRLALQVAAKIVDRYEHGSFFISIAAVTAPDGVIPAIAEALDVREAVGRDCDQP